MAATELAPWISAAGSGGVRNSMIEQLGDGSTTQWNFNFSGGYISQTDIKAYTYEPVSATFTALTLTPAMFTGPNTLKVSPAVAAGTFLVIYRDTQKTVPLVNFSTGAPMDETNLDLLANQAVFIAAEMLDRFDAVNSSADDATSRSLAALAAAQSAVITAGAANTTANSASTTAGAAQTAAAAAVTTANAANTTANGINAKAQSALDNSLAAVSTANAASGTANGIAATANSALTNANNAVTTANSASTAAGNAVTTANGVDSKASTALTNAAAAVATANGAALGANRGQCRLYGDATVTTGLRLYPWNGNQLFIAGAMQTIPAAGVFLAGTATTAGRYFIYAYMNAGVMTLEASTTAYVRDTTTYPGMPIKTGDATRTLVGMAYNAGNTFAPAASTIAVLNWWNRRVITVGGSSSNLSLGAGPAGVFAGCSMLSWSDEIIRGDGISGCSGSQISTASMYLARASVSFSVTSSNSFFQANATMTQTTYGVLGGNDGYAGYQLYQGINAGTLTSAASFCNFYTLG